MATLTKKQSSQTKRAAIKQTTVYQEPKRLSKLGQWMRNNPGGIVEYVDWRAVNK